MEGKAVERATEMIRHPVVTPQNLIPPTVGRNSEHFKTYVLVATECKNARVCKVN